MRKDILNGVKEALRVFIFAGVSALVAWGLAQLGVADQSNLVVIVGTVLLKAVDRSIHESPTAGKGILPF